MLINFQDELDEYLLRGNEMPESKRVLFDLQLQNDEELMRQLELRRDVMAAIASREEKLRMMEIFKERYDYRHAGSLHFPAGICCMIEENAADLVEREDDMVAACVEEERRTAAPMERSRRAPAPAERGKQPAAASHRKRWWWLGGIAALLIVGFFTVRGLMKSQSAPTGQPQENMRGGDEIFSCQPDTVVSDTCQ
ncbi:MAG: hypothetical protein LUC44_01360 [Prevotellaceae bacterium]|nr:hypothetical protein [Prevotellaceae bacterium]